eukprot:CAMPEP_0194242546 /NCGR_PEP_ID=MMETSP0158-20130606/8051_1 /TAXON_ID=33649 /ORGANISM="Thalassionema nitzschioides, Strain L26-B" /LENGTH=503 /DNA_ID=CAMNT_0038977657 /DNA_START=232 /DNA_END=1743 /DNA_ORIENTATION=-
MGIAIATPMAAAFQGAALLQDFRNNHLHAPVPLSPSRGIVVMKSTDSRANSIENKISLASRHISSISESSEENRPLRLLVIGDSLAVGVGVMKQSTPILPESIAKSLSQAHGGRAVSWTCVGTPGASSSRIVKDILSFKEDSKNGLMERKFKEWKATKQKAEEWLYRRQRQEASFKTSEEELQISAAKKIKKWWRRVLHDARSFHRHVIQKNDALSETVEEKQVAKRCNSNETLALANEYDIAVVLTGLNDLKEVWLPFMMNRTFTSDRDGASIKDKLLKVLHALKQRMNLDLPNDSCATSKEDERGNVYNSLAKKPFNHRGPIVVFPAIPAAPTHPLVQCWPLSWFTVPLLRAVDNHKRLIAERFPNSVLYVEQPSTSSVEDMEAGRGPIFDKRKAEEVLLSLTDATKKAKEKVEKLMQQHYERWTKDNSHGYSKSTLDSLDHHYEGCVDPYNLTINVSKQRNAKESGVGSTLLSLDKVHPNDEGYDFWGRHIAAAIVAHIC